MEGKQRPTSVTVIAILLILCACLLMVVAAGVLIAVNPQVRKMLADHGIALADNPQAQEMLRSRGWALLLGSGVILVSAVAVLKRQNWGRLLCLCFVPGWVAFTWVQYGFQRYFGLVGILYLFALILLTRSKASAFFASAAADAKKPGE